jgi:hypothetical protein
LAALSTREVQISEPLPPEIVAEMESTEEGRQELAEEKCLAELHELFQQSRDGELSVDLIQAKLSEITDPASRQVWEWGLLRPRDAELIDASIRHKLATEAEQNKLLPPHADAPAQSPAQQDEFIDVTSTSSDRPSSLLLLVETPGSNVSETEDALPPDTHWRL